MSTPAAWLSSEIDRWVADQIITPEQAARLHALYPAPPTARPWGLIVFFGIGAVVVGLGVVLLFAYNWDAIPKAGKLAIVFASIIAAHGSGLLLWRQRDWRRLLGEGFLLLGTMLFGAGLWLVAQIYHINEHFPTAFLIWGLGALGLAWALPSVGQALVATFMLTAWASAERFAFEAPVHAAVPLLLATVVPLAWRQRSALLLAVVLSSLYLLMMLNVSDRGGGSAAFLVAFSVSTGLLALRRLAVPHGLPRAMDGVLRFFGLIGFLLCAFIIGFRDAADDVLELTVRPGRDSAAPAVYLVGVFAFAVGTWILTALRARRRSIPKLELEEPIFPLALVLAHVLALTGATEWPGLVAAVFNLVLLGIATAWIVRGCREGHVRAIILGSLVVAATVFSRYFDLFDSLAARGLAFVIFGVLLFVEGFYYRRLREPAAAKGDAA